MATETNLGVQEVSSRQREIDDAELAMIGLHAMSPETIDLREKLICRNCRGWGCECCMPLRGGLEKSLD